MTTVYIGNEFIIANVWLLYWYRVKGGVIITGGMVWYGTVPGKCNITWIIGQTYRKNQLGTSAITFPVTANEYISPVYREIDWE